MNLQCFVQGSAWSLMLICLLTGSITLAEQQIASLDFQWLHTKRAAERLFEQRQYAKATEALRDAATGAPDETQRAALLAKAAIAQAYHGQVEEALRHAQAISDKDFTHFAQLSIHSLQNDAQNIVDTYAGVSIQDWPESICARGFELRGQAYESLNKFHEAIADYEHCVKAAGDKTEIFLSVLMNIASLHLKLGQNEEAKATYQRIINMFGHPPERLAGGHNVYPSAISKLTAILAAEKQYEQAINCIERYPSGWSTSNTFGILQQRGDVYRDWGKLEKALDAYRDALKFVKEHESHPRAPATILKLTQSIEAIEKTQQS